jgi:hypothetical protein
MVANFLVGLAAFGIVFYYLGHLPDLQSVHVSLLGALSICAFFVPGIGPWPIPLLLAIAVYGGTCALVPALRRTVGWVRRGRLDGTTWALLGVTIVVAAGALVAWFFLLHPDVKDIAAAYPRLPLWAVPLAGIAFAASNAVAEEVLWRGVMMQALDAAVGPIVSLLVQGASFGLFHIHGFPRGAWGVAMAPVYGLMLGYLRRRSRGMLAPWLAHFFADAVVFVLMGLVVRGG